MNKQLFLFLFMSTSLVAMEPSRPLDQLARAQEETARAFETMQQELTEVRRAGKVEFLTRKILEKKLAEERIASAQNELELLRTERGLTKSKNLMLYSWIGAPVLALITYFWGRASH